MHGNPGSNFLVPGGQPFCAEFVCSPYASTSYSPKTCTSCSFVFNCECVNGGLSQHVCPVVGW